MAQSDDEQRATSTAATPATPAALTPRAGLLCRWSMATATFGMAAALSGCVVPYPSAYDQPAYYQTSPVYPAAYPTAYPATVQSTVVYPGAVAAPYSYYAAPGYYSPGLSIGIYGGGHDRRRPPPPPPRPERPGFNRPGFNPPGFNQPGFGRPGAGQQPARPIERPPGANQNRPVPPGAGMGAGGNNNRPRPQQPTFRTERDGGG